MSRLCRNNGNRCMYGTWKRNPLKNIPSEYKKQENPTWANLPLPSEFSCGLQTCPETWKPTRKLNGNTAQWKKPELFLIPTPFHKMRRPCPFSVFLHDFLKRFLLFRASFWRYNILQFVLLRPLLCRPAWGPLPDVSRNPEI